MGFNQIYTQIYLFENWARKLYSDNPHGSKKEPKTSPIRPVLGWPGLWALSPYGHLKFLCRLDKKEYKSQVPCLRLWSEVQSPWDKTYHQSNQAITRTCYEELLWHWLSRRTCITRSMTRKVMKETEICEITHKENQMQQQWRRWGLDGYDCRDHHPENNCGDGDDPTWTPNQDHSLMAPHCMFLYSWSVWNDTRPSETTRWKAQITYHAWKFLVMYLSKKKKKLQKFDLCPWN